MQFQLHHLTKSAYLAISASRELTACNLALEEHTHQRIKTNRKVTARIVQAVSTVATMTTPQAMLSMDHVQKDFSVQVPITSSILRMENVQLENSANQESRQLDVIMVSIRIGPCKVHAKYVQEDTIATLIRCLL